MGVFFALIDVRIGHWLGPGDRADGEKGDLLCMGAMCVCALPQDLHEAVYRESRLLGVGITLLHIWAWEHFLVTRLVCMMFREIDQPYVFMYGGLMTQPHLGKLEFWQRALDDLDRVIWRPYTDCEA